MKHCDKCGVYYRAEHDCAVPFFKMDVGCQYCGNTLKETHFTGCPMLEDDGEYTGGSVSYYRVKVETPTTAPLPYTAECNDIIEALDMNYAEGNAFKAIWRRAAARQGMAKRGYTDGLYDAEKVEFFGHRLVVQERNK